MKKCLLRIIVAIIIILFPILFMEYHLSLQQNSVQQDWAIENFVINHMNREKLKNSSPSSPPIWLHVGEEIPSKKENIKRILIVGDSYIWR